MTIHYRFDATMDVGNDLQVRLREPSPSSSASGTFVTLQFLGDEATEPWKGGKLLLMLLEHIWPHDIVVLGSDVQYAWFETVMKPFKRDLPTVRRVKTEENLEQEARDYQEWDY
jgi:hypothetical protein